MVPVWEQPHGAQSIFQPDMMNRSGSTVPLKLTQVLCRALRSPGCVFETNVQQDNGANCEKCFQSLHIELSHHLKSCQYPRQSIDLPSLLGGLKLSSVLIDYVDWLCGVWMSCRCHDIRPWQQSHLFTWHELLLWISKSASGQPRAKLQMRRCYGGIAGRGDNRTPVRLTPYWLECAAIKPKYQFLHKELSKLQRKRSQFPLWDAGVDALSRGENRIRE